MTTLGKRWTPRAERWSACQSVLSGLSPAGVAAARGVNKSTVLGWLREYGYRYDRASKQWVRRS